MKYIPILFSTPMVQAILDGRKTMTRRVVKPQPHLQEDSSFINFAPSFGWCVKHQVEENPSKYEITSTFKCPYGKVGDVLWVRETWAGHMHFNPKGYSISDIVNSSLVEPKFYYLATKPEYGPIGRWRPSIHMPKTACRLFLEITDIRVERLQDISEEDAKSEGILDMLAHIPNSTPAYFKYDVTKKDAMEPGGHWAHVADDAIHSFQSLWQSINGEQSWQANHWVWVVSFKRTEKPNDF